MDAVDQAALVDKGEVTPGELLDAAIERIERLNPPLNAVVIEWFADARAAAAEPLPAGPLRGVPFLLKDLYTSFAGQTLSNGNRRLKEAAIVDTVDTTLVSRYRAAGLVIAGRTNSPEFGSLPTTQPLAWGPTHNPWALERTPGGSSGGAAAAVAAGMVPIANASDGGGSIRIPASCCGLVGLKPSQGRTTLGPARAEVALGVEHCVSRSVRDTAVLLDAVCGPGVGDSVIAPTPARPYAEEVGASPGRLRIGVMDVHPRGELLDPVCVDAARSAGRMLEGLGHSVEAAWPAVLADETLPHKFMTMWATNMAMAARAVSEAIGREVTAEDLEPVNWIQVEYARKSSAVELAVAQAAMHAFRRQVQQWWADGWDLLVTPTLAEPPPPLEEFASNADDPAAPMRRAGQFVPYTPAFNMSGQPAISLPLHWTDDGIPVGVQLVAAYGREDVLLPRRLPTRGGPPLGRPPSPGLTSRTSRTGLTSLRRPR